MYMLTYNNDLYSAYSTQTRVPSVFLDNTTTTTADGCNYSAFSQP